MRISDWSSDVCSSDLVTVDRAHVLATPGMDRHSAYVALSRHRDGVQLHYDRDDFGDDRRLVRTLSRERAKDMASDYGRDRDRKSRRVGKECVSTCSYRWSPYHSKKNNKKQTQN